MGKRPPVIAIDGPAAVGKGTVAREVARQLGFVHLDSGRFYRAVGHRALAAGADLGDPAAVLAAARPLRERAVLAALLASSALDSEEVGAAASIVATMPEVRAALLESQRAVGEVRGVVADGRDMAAVVFPDAILKVFLDASEQVREGRMLKRARANAADGSKMESYLAQFKERNQRDATRSLAPVVPAEGAHVITTDALSVAEVVAKVVGLYERNLKAT